MSIWYGNLTKEVLEIFIHLAEDVAIFSFRPVLNRLDLFPIFFVVLIVDLVNRQICIIFGIETFFQFVWLSNGVHHLLLLDIDFGLAVLSLEIFLEIFEVFCVIVLHWNSIYTILYSTLFHN